MERKGTMHEEDIRRIIRILEESDQITEIEMVSYPFGGKRIRVSKQGLAPAQAPAVPAAPSAAPAAAAPAPVSGEQEGMHTVKAPMVGTFYTSPNPESPTFVNIGDRVAPGRVLCIIEAMKLMNEIECDTSGVIKEVLAENGQPIEFGQPLFLIASE